MKLTQKQIFKIIDNGSDNNHHNLTENIIIGIDWTDHIMFFCNFCKKPLNVYKVEKKKYLCDLTNNCTHIHFFCKKCNLIGYKKFYWNDGIDDEDENNHISSHYDRTTHGKLSEK